MQIKKSLSINENETEQNNYSNFQEPVASKPSGPVRQSLSVGGGKRIKIKKIISLIVVILAVGGVIGSVYYYRQYQALKANPNLEAQKETEALVLALGKLMELPADETPTVATIMEKERLKDQPFFAKAENGDKLLAYTKAQQAILYRPSINKIINVGPIVINQPEAATLQKQNQVEPKTKK